jgi:hypothetical protein
MEALKKLVRSKLKAAQTLESKHSIVDNMFFKVDFQNLERRNSLFIKDNEQLYQDIQ